MATTPHRFSSWARIPAILMLVVLEIMVAFAIVWAVVGWRPGFAANIHHVDFVPRAIAPIAAGSSPNVTIDDADSRVIVEPSSDGRVHVTDQTWFYGGVWADGEVAQLRVRRTPEGVSIVRPHERGVSWFWLGFGEYDRAVDVAVPPHAVVSIVHCAGARISGLAGSLDVWSDDGRIEASDVRSDRISLHSDDGRIELTNVDARRLVANTDDGRIEARSLRTHPGGTYDVMTNDGQIVIGFVGAGNATIASSSDDTIRLNGERIAEGGSAALRLGSGSAQVRLTTEDGSIRITTNGAL